MVYNICKFKKLVDQLFPKVYQNSNRAGSCIDD